MKGSILNEPWVEITKREAADTLANTKKRRYLEPFILKACTLQEAAEHLKVNLNTMHYQVQRLLKLELLKVVELKKRKGMSSKVYRSSASKYFVALKNTSVLDSEELLFNLEAQSLRKIVKRSLEIRASDEGEWGLAFHLSEDGKIEIEFVAKEQKEAKWPMSDDVFTPLMNDYQTLQLSTEDAVRVTKTLKHLSRKISKKEIPNGTSYLIHLAIVPLEN